MIPTKRGIVMFVIGAFLYGLAWQTHIAWFYVADALVWAVLLINLPVPWLNLRGVSAQRHIATRGGGQPQDIFEDDTINLEIELHNHSFFPKLLVTLLEDCPLVARGQTKQGFIVATLAPGGSIRTAYEIQCYRRGVYTFGPLQLCSTAPFGLIRAHRSLEAPLKVTVYPRVLPMRIDWARGHLQGQVLASSMPRPSGEFRGSREYQQGDRLRSIHWRNSAKHGRLMVKEFDELPEGELRLAFNPGLDLGDGRDTTLEYSIKIAASLARCCFLNGRPFRMWPWAHEKHVSSWHSLLEHLARMESISDDSIQKLLSHKTSVGASVAIVSAADGQALRALQQEPRYGPTTVVLLEGFGLGEDSNAGQALLRTGATVVRCQPGDLPGAMFLLGEGLTRPGVSYDLAHSPR